MIFFLVIFSAVLLLVLKTLFTLPPKNDDERLFAFNIPIDKDKVYRNLSRAIMIQTVSSHDHREDHSRDFTEFHRFIDSTFQTIGERLKKETVNNYSLLYEWEGAEKDRCIILMAHIDVVPANPDEWKYPPFSGEITETHIWGRGTLDIIFCLTGMLEAVECLLEERFIPPVTVFLAFGHDEEIGGKEGARNIVNAVKKKNIAVEMVIDEGGFISEGLLKGVNFPLGMIALAEKGYCGLELSCSGTGGTSVIPPKQTAIGTLCEAITMLQRKPFPPRLVSVSRDMFADIGKRSGFFMKFIFTNQWLFKPIILSFLNKSPTTASSIKTTIAPTIISGGDKENVLPTSAKASINVRILPGDTIESVFNKFRRMLKKVPVELKICEFSNDPPPIASTRTKYYRYISRIITAIFPDAVPVPFLGLGTTDSRYFSEICSNVIRFSPGIINPENVNKAHGIDECISKENYIQAIRFILPLSLILTK